MVIRHGVIPASRGGKAKTALQAVAILLYILPFGGFLHVIAVVVMTLAVIVTGATGVDYILRAQTLRNTSPRAQAKRERRAAEAAEVAEREAAEREAAEREAAERETVALDAAARPGAEPKI
jgi:CDP-diacylglycerol--glycerol-3-phosphate 3-phosphatidyltransferase